MLAAAFVTAILIDAAVGELPARWHPVVWMGWFTRRLTHSAPRAGAKALVWGAATVLLVAGGAALDAWAILLACEDVPCLHFLASVFLIQSAFAARLLDHEVARLEHHLRAGELAEARGWLPRLCSRDPDALGEHDLAGAGIASLAENANDSVVAPWFWMLIFGVPAMVGYRAINTLDAMIGYRGEYEKLGKCAARLDDLTGWIPARITAGVLLVSGFAQGASFRSGLGAGLDGNRQTPSPCGGWPMGVMAGLLNGRLTKPGVYELHREGGAATVTMIGQARRIARGAYGATIAASIMAIYAFDSYATQ